MKSIFVLENKTVLKDLGPFILKYKYQEPVKLEKSRTTTSRKAKLNKSSSQTNIDFLCFLNLRKTTSEYVGKKMKYSIFGIDVITLLDLNIVMLSS